MHNTSQAKSFDKRRGRYSVERGIKFKKRCERKTVTRENGNSILRSNGYVNLKDRELTHTKITKTCESPKIIISITYKKNNTHVFLRARQVTVT